MWVAWLTLAGCQDFFIAGPSDDVAPGSTVPRIEVSPIEVEFGDRLAGDVYRSPVTVRNTGGGHLRIDALRIEGDASFSTEWQPPLPFEIGAGYAYTFPVVFTPAAGGEVSAVLQLVNNGQNAEEGVVALSGVALAGSVSLDPPAWELGAVTPGCRYGEVFRVTNTGNLPVDVDAPWIESSGVAAWAVVEPAPFHLEPGDFRSLRVQVDAIGAGAAELVVRATPGVELRAPLSLTPEWPIEGADERVVPAVARTNVLFAVDGSRSMTDEQATLSSEFRSFIGAFEGTDVDWRIGVAIRDDGCFSNGVLSPSTSNVVGQFDQAVRAIGQGGDLTERLLSLADRALSHRGPGDCNAGFLEQGDLHLVFVSDEADQSPLPWSVYLSNYQFATPGGQAVAHAVVDAAGVCGQGTLGAAGYAEVVDETGGLLLDICSPAWGASLVDIANAAVLAGRSLHLSVDQVDVASIRVLLDGVEQA
ncbi:MAG TPA: choice-of-anchor D domain-containing protein, partial [Myxococcota bacterium]|nr:choice-of-anchor D domain-containing protein [Myxococcota bacterium]